MSKVNREYRFRAKGTMTPIKERKITFVCRMVFRVSSHVLMWIIVFYLFVQSPFFPVREVIFDPQPVRISDALVGEAPEVEFNRTIHRKSLIRYYSVTRNAKDQNDEVDDLVGCEGGSQPFTYLPQEGPLIGKDLVWWTNNPLCGDLEPGVYWTDTCWTIVDPIGDLIPVMRGVLGVLSPRVRICEASPVFEIHARSPAGD